MHVQREAKKSINFKVYKMHFENIGSLFNFQNPH